MPYVRAASSTIDLPSGVSSLSEASAAASASSRSVTPGSGTNSSAMRLPKVIVPVLSSSSVSTSPEASTARPDFAITFALTSRSMPAMPIAESSPPMVVGIRVTSSAEQKGHRYRGAGVDRERLERRHDDQEDDRHADEKDRERDLVRRLLPHRALDQADHPVEEALAGPRGHADLQPVGHDSRAAGDRRAVAAALADHGRRLAGDRELVDRGDALDHLAVRRDDVARLDQHEVIQASDRGSRPARTPCVQAPRGAWPGSPAACRAAHRRAPCRALRPPPRRSWRTAR